MDPRLNDKAVSAHASLTRIPKLRDDCAIDRSIDVSVVEYDEWRVSTEFHRNALQGRYALLHENLANSRGARESDFGDVRVAGQLAADCGRGPGHDVDYAGGRLCLLREHPPCKARIRRQF
jgi:hypothetical protein